MLNDKVAKAAVAKRRADQLFFAVVSECFIKALPLDKSNMSAEEEQKLQKYTWNVLESLGGISALESAFDPKNKSIDQNVYLAQIYQLCMETAHTSDSHVDEEIKNDPMMDMANLKDKTALNKAQFSVFAGKKNALDLDKVADVIKTKTLEVIKDEKEKYDKEEELDQEIKDAMANKETDDKEDADSKEFNPAKDSVDQDALNSVSSSPDIRVDINGKPNSVPEDDTAEVPAKKDEYPEADVVESYLNIILDKNAPKHHISVFSRLQETAMEAMDCVKCADEEDFYPLINKVTFESLLKDDSIPTISKVMESLNTSAIEEITEIPQENRGKMATLVSIIVYTMMETLKTMGIFCPSINTVQSFVRNPHTAATMKQAEVKDMTESAKNVVQEAASCDLSKKSTTYLSNLTADLRSGMELAQEALTKDPANEDMISIANESKKYLEEVDGILKQRADDDKASKESSAMEAASFKSRMQMSNDVAQFNKIHDMFKNNALVDEIQIGVNSGRTASVLDVKCLGSNHQVVRESFMDMQYPVEPDRYVSYLVDTFHKSKMDGTPKRVTIKMNDGKGTKISIN